MQKRTNAFRVSIQLEDRFPHIRPDIRLMQCKGFHYNQQKRLDLPLTNRNNAIFDLI